jgi:hypothetical protein
MVDTRILAAWLVWMDDPELFERYKDFGQGKLKLLKLNFEEHIGERDKVDPSHKEYVAWLEARVNEDMMEEFQTISLAANFADRSIYKMAEDVGLTPTARAARRGAAAVPLSTTVDGRAGLGVLDEPDRAAFPTRPEPPFLKPWPDLRFMCKPPFALRGYSAAVTSTRPPEPRPGRRWAGFRALTRRPARGTIAVPDAGPGRRPVGGAEGRSIA